MTPHTQAQYLQCLRRFARYQTNHPGPLLEQIRGWLASVTPSVGHTGYLALRSAYGPQVDWRQVSHPRARRNEAQLQASLLSVADRERLRDSLATPREWALVELLWTCRRAEAARARWKDVDLSRGIIYIVAKGGAPTWRVLPQSAQIALAEWFGAMEEPPDESPIFPGHGGRPINPTTVNHWLRTIFRRAGLYKRWRGAHAFRRTFATAYLHANPGDIRGLQALLGHASITTTSLYTYLQPEDLAPRLARVAL